MAKTKKEFNREYYLKHKERILEKKKTRTQKQYPRKPEYWQRWYAKNKDLYLAKKRVYTRTSKGKQCQLERLYRFIDKNPFISERYLEFIERMIRANERTVGLTFTFEDSGRVGYRV